MDSKKTKKKAPVKPVVKPYLKGRLVDGGTLKAAAAFFGSLAIMAVANLLLSAALLWDNLVIRIAVNVLMVLVIDMLFYQSGASSGAAAVNQGEILYQRRANGHNVPASEEAACFHPLKGYVTGLLGAAPFLLCGLVLAATAQRQMTGLGALPSWLQVLERREEIGGALGFYHQMVSLTVEDVLRMIVRVYIMPFVNMVGTENMDGLLTLERLSALVMLLPAIAYGLGYQQGVRVRSQVHTDIATSKRKRARKEKKRQQARASKGPEQLN